MIPLFSGGSFCGKGHSKRMKEVVAEGKEHSYGT